METPFNELNPGKTHDFRRPVFLRTEPFTPKKKPKKEVDYFWKHQTFGRTRVSSGGVGAALPAARRCAVLPILDLHRARLVPLQVGKKEEKK